jgi:hypothetical protein
LLGSRVRIPLGARMFVFVCVYVVMSCVGRGLCDELITQPKYSYDVSNTITVTSKMRPRPDLCWSAIGRKSSSSSSSSSDFHVIHRSIPDKEDHMSKNTSI